MPRPVPGQRPELLAVPRVRFEAAEEPIGAAVGQLARRLEGLRAAHGAEDERNALLNGPGEVALAKRIEEVFHDGLGRLEASDLEGARQLDRRLARAGSFAGVVLERRAYDDTEFVILRAA